MALQSRERLPVGAHFAAGTPPARSEGYVTSSYVSPTLGEPVAFEQYSPEEPGGWVSG